MNQPTPGIVKGFASILWTVLFTAYGQIVLKWQVAKVGILPTAFLEKVAFFIRLIGNPWILSGMPAGF